ncbi:hypothetical protein Belba_2286 [Belliella baltica DSM 15883]|uniref:Uncharacterized protein n=1 Tax=Belliella baltica (strain DSM 15883 / CIP 108006 / LMG 21964 / BA134) TaxID=866536 RepID=I3Z6I2_BELBD|nr:hypothetical protein Belba_2286 [Belliella baltica DSM 15883]
MKINKIIILHFLLLPILVQAQQIDLQKVTNKHLFNGIMMLNELVSIPNDSNQPDQLIPNLIKNDLFLFNSNQLELVIFPKQMDPFSILPRRPKYHHQ